MKTFILWVIVIIYLFLISLQTYFSYDTNSKILFLFNVVESAEKK